jgi:hypothetical protein
LSADKLVGGQAVGGRLVCGQVGIGRLVGGRVVGGRVVGGQVAVVPYFQTKNINLGKFLRVFQWKTSVYLMDILCNLLPFDILYDHLVYFVVIWYIFPRFGMQYKEKSGNAGLHLSPMS